VHLSLLALRRTPVPSELPARAPVRHTAADPAQPPLSVDGLPPVSADGLPLGNPGRACDDRPVTFVVRVL